MAVDEFYVSPEMMENPFYYEGIKLDEYLTEKTYYGMWLAKWAIKGKPYKPLMKQLRDGEISRIPAEYKRYCIDENWDEYLYE